LENLGVSNTSIDRVDHSNLEDIKDQMRSQAVINARAGALALTKPLNQTIGPAIHITEVEISNTGSQFRGQLNEVVVMGYGIRNKKLQELPKIEFEKIKVVSNLHVKFILKP
jgi:uncharacterized protein